MTVEIRDSDEATRWMSAGMCLMRLSRPTETEVTQIAKRVIRAVSEAGALPPVGVLADVGHLLSGGALKFEAPLPAADKAVLSAVRSYEDQFLGRLAQDPRLEAIADALMRLPEGSRDDAVALLITRVSERIGYDKAVSMSPGVARRATEIAADELLELGYDALRQGHELTEALAAGYADLVRGARRTGALLTDADVFVFENLTVLDSLSQRLSIEQVVEVSEALSRMLPKRMKPKSPNQRGRTPTNIEDEDRYPIGGFSSISTSGSLENLVTSELIYMEGADSSEVDLFDMRYVEGELLFYTRDESVFIRSRRQLNLVLSPQLVEGRFKDAQLQYQRLVILLGMINCVVQRLAAWLNEEGLFFRVVFLTEDHSKTPLIAEHDLAALLLREWVEKEMAEVVQIGSLDELLEQAEEAARNAQVDVVVGGMGLPKVKAELNPMVRVASLSLKEASPELRWLDQHGAVGVDPEPWGAWVAVTMNLLQSVIDGR